MRIRGREAVAELASTFGTGIPRIEVNGDLPLPFSVGPQVQSTHANEPVRRRLHLRGERDQGKVSGCLEEDGAVSRRWQVRSGVHERSLTVSGVDGRVNLLAKIGGCAILGKAFQPGAGGGAGAPVGHAAVVRPSNHDAESGVCRNRGSSRQRIAIEQPGERDFILGRLHVQALGLCGPSRSHQSGQSQQQNGPDAQYQRSVGVPEAFRKLHIFGHLYPTLVTAHIC